MLGQFAFETTAEVAAVAGAVAVFDPTCQVGAFDGLAGEPHSTGVESTPHTSSLHTEMVVARIRLTLRIGSAALRSRLL